MIGMKFLRPVNVAGLEFMDFQNSNFFQELAEAFNSEIENGILVEEPDVLKGIIERYTGMRNITLNLNDFGNLAVDAGYINPGNSFNIDGIEQYLSRNDSKLGQWFKNNREVFLKGSIDFETGKLGGSYAEIPFEFFINKNLETFISPKVLAKYNASYGEALAAGFIHECGHVIGGLMMVHTCCEDNIIQRAAIHFLSKQTNSVDRVSILKDAHAQLNPDDKFDERQAIAIAENNDTTEYLVYFKKTSENRNVRRALSLGVPYMSSEVIADAYSIRMGCGKALTIGMAAIIAKGNERKHLKMWAAAVITSAIFFGYFGLLVGTINLALMGKFGLGLFAFFEFTSLVNGVVPGIYNTDYRRLLNIRQEMILKLKTIKDMDPLDRKRLITQLDYLLPIIEENKPFFEGKWFQRFALWLTNGSDGKYIDIEHYTQSITNHDVNVVAAKFQTL